MKKLRPEFVTTLKNLIAEKASKDFDELSRRQILNDVVRDLEWLANGHAKFNPYDVVLLLNKSRTQFNKLYYADFRIGKQFFQIAADPAKDFFDDPFATFIFPP